MDLISKKDVLDEIVRFSTEEGSSVNCTQLYCDVNNMPSQNKWIPCSEKLPDEGINVLCKCQANIFEVLKLTHDGWYHDAKHCYMKGFVIAWMPLPEPYKAESEDKE